MKNIKSRKTSLVAALLVTLFIISLLNVVNVKANEKNIVNLILSENGEISPPVFDINDGYLYPGAEINKDFVLRNTTHRKYKIENIGLKDFKIKDINGKTLDVNDNSDLKVMDEFCESIECKISCDGIFKDKILHVDDIKELIKGKSLQRQISILSGNEKKFNVVVSMKTSTSNNMQGLQANFNMVFNAISINEEPPVEPSNPPDPPDPPVDPPVYPPVQPPIDLPVDTPVQLLVNPPTDPIQLPVEPSVDPPINSTEPSVEPTDSPIEKTDIPDNTGSTDTENAGIDINPSEDSDSESIDKEIIQTGSPIDTVSLSIIGLIFIGTGVAIYFKKKEK